MERQKLKETLHELHAELASSDAVVDPETRVLLEQLSADIDRLSGSGEPLPVEERPKKEGMIDQLLGLTEEFEESHPKLAEVIGRVAGSLSRIGI